MAHRKTCPTQPLGRNGPMVSQLGYGAMELSADYLYGQAPISEEQGFAMLDRAWELGCTFWDTAGSYGNNEELIGRWLQKHPERRQDVFIATKFAMGIELRDGKANLMTDSSPKQCLESCERSLRRLGVDCLDLFYVHRFDTVTPVEKTMGALKHLVEQGKIKHIGFSECSSATLRRGHAIHPITAVQIEYNPWTLDIETAAGTHLLQTCRELGVAVVCYSPLGRGILTGRFQSRADLQNHDMRRGVARLSEANFDHNIRLLRIFEQLARDKQATTSQIVLAWIMAQGPDFFPIPGTKTPKYLDSNVGACDVRLTAAEAQHVRDAIAQQGGVKGSREMDLSGAGANNHYADTPNL